jgi:hypothetical protein
MSGSLSQDVAYFSQDDSRHFSKSKVKKTIVPFGEKSFIIRHNHLHG